MPPPLLLVSAEEDPNNFQGVVQDTSGLSGRKLRADNSVDVKELMSKQKSKWGSRQILDWIDHNLESGRSETHNMENLISHDVNQKYTVDNQNYRDKILKKLGSQDSCKPVFIGGAPSDSSRFLLPRVENGKLEKLRSRFQNSLAAPS